MKPAVLLVRPGRRRGLHVLLVLGVLAGVAGLLWRHYTPPPPPPPFLIAGGRLMQPLVADLAQRFSQQTGYEVQVEAGGAMAGMAAVKRGAIDIAMVGQPVPGLFSDPQTRQHLLARNSLAFIVHHRAPVRELSQAQIRQVLTGQVRNWKALGGPDAPIELLSWRKPALIALFVEWIVLDGQPVSHHARLVDDASQMIAGVTGNPLALGYVSLQDMPARSAIIPLTIDGVPFSRATILSGHYPYIQDMYLVGYGECKPQETAFMRFIRSPQAQVIIEQHHLAPVYARATENETRHGQ